MRLFSHIANIVPKKQFQETIFWQILFSSNGKQNRALHDYFFCL
jgi:hypothetical protein